jgi:hypothetical protein
MRCGSSGAVLLRPSAGLWSVGYAPLCQSSSSLCFEIVPTDPENCLGVMTGRRCTLGTGIEKDRGCDVLVTEELADDFVLAGISVGEDFRYSMSEAVRRHIEPRVSIGEFTDLAAQRTVSLG